MSTLKNCLAGLSLGFVVALGADAAFAATTINVDLTNKSPMPEMPTNMAYGMPGVDKAKAKSPMTVKLSAASAKTGAITFNVKNSSKDTVHELVVIPIKEANKPLPYNEAESALDEEKLKSLGEVSELDPGKSGKLTLTLAPGKYLLVCDVAGHYASGMWAEFTVTK